MLHTGIIDMKYKRSESGSTKSVFSAEESSKELYQVSVDARASECGTIFRF